MRQHIRGFLNSMRYITFYITYLLYLREEKEGKGRKGGVRWKGRERRGREGEWISCILLSKPWQLCNSSINNSPFSAFMLLVGDRKCTQSVKSSVATVPRICLGTSLTGIMLVKTGVKVQ